MGDLRAREQHRGRVRAGGHAGAAADAGRRIHRLVRDRFGHQHGVRFRRAAGVRADEPARLDDTVEGRTVHDEVPDHRDGLRAERFDHDRVAVLEGPHVELTGRRRLHGTVGAPVDHHPAGAADALAAVVVERDGVLPLRDQLLVEHVQHLEERHVGRDVLHGIDLEAPGVLGVLLAPDFEREIHYL